MFVFFGRQNVRKVCSNENTIKKQSGGIMIIIIVMIAKVVIIQRITFKSLIKWQFINLLSIIGWTFLQECKQTISTQINDTINKPMISARLRLWRRFRMAGSSSMFVMTILGVFILILDPDDFDWLNLVRCPWFSINFLPNRPVHIQLVTFFRFFQALKAV